MNRLFTLFYSQTKRRRFNALVWRILLFMVFLMIDDQAYQASAEKGTAVFVSPPAVAISDGKTEAYEATPMQEIGIDKIGESTVMELYISPNGDDANDGLSAATPLRTLTSAWSKIPSGTLTMAYRLNLLPGTYPCEPAEPDDCRNYFTDRTGTEDYPITIQATNGPGSVTLRGGMDINHVSYLNLSGFTLVGGSSLPLNASGNNLLHFASVDHIWLRQMTVNGPDCTEDTCNNVQEVLKVNQAQYVYVEDSDIGGTWHSVVDYVSVQYGHFIRNHIHTAGQWCMYMKGGTAYQHIEGNEFENCQLGVQAGQSTNMAVIHLPWVHYEAYDIKLVNNLMHDLPGVSLSVMGGYNILFANNTLYHIGYNDNPGDALLQMVHGERGCNRTDEIPDPVSVCNNLIAQGGWGPDYETPNLAAIPNRNIYVYNNLIYNPPNTQTHWAHFNIFGPIVLPEGYQNLPTNPVTDDNLVIAGNLIWNGPSEHPLGVDDSTGCASNNPTCNTTQLLRDNSINSEEPQLVNPEAGDYHPVAGGNVFSATTFLVPNFTWDHFSPEVPGGNLNNTVTQDYDGAMRSAEGAPGAFANEGVSLSYIYLPILTRGQ